MMDTNRSIPKKLSSLVNADDKHPDRAFVCFASPERRCLGALRLAKNYRAQVVCLLKFADEKNTECDENLSELRRLARDVGPVLEISVTHADPIFGLDAIVKAVNKSNGHVVTIDTTTFPKD